MSALNLKNSLEMQAKGAALIPGLAQLLSKRPDMFTRGVWPCYFRRAKGVEVEDLDGNVYRDFSIGGIGATVLGYADDDVNDAVKAAIDLGSSSSLNCPEEVELAELLVSLHPWAGMVRYCRGGGEAMALAVRIARAHTGKDAVVFCGYHGWADWYLAANVGTENALGEHLIAGLKPAGVPRKLSGTALPFRYNNIEDFRAAVSKAGDDLAAIVMEPIRNFEPTAEFMDEIHRVAKAKKAPLIIDEVSAGFRLCNGGAHLKVGWRPDIAVFSKALGNGFPMAAVVGKPEVMEAAQSSFISSTNWTDRVGPVAALAMIRKFIRVDASKRLVATGAQVEEGWTRLASQHGLKMHIGGIKPMLHFSFDEDNNVRRAYFTQEMLKKGYLAAANCYAMYAHTPEMVEGYLAAVDEVWSELAALVKKGAVASKLEGKPAVSGFQRLA